MPTRCPHLIVGSAVALLAGGLLGACSSTKANRKFLDGEWVQPQDETARLSRLTSAGTVRVFVEGVKGGACNDEVDEDSVLRALRETSGTAYQVVNGVGDGLRLRVVLEGDSHSPAPAVTTYRGVATVQARDVEGTILWESTSTADATKPAPLGSLAERECADELHTKLTESVKSFVLTKVKRAADTPMTVVTMGAPTPAQPVKAARRLAVLEFSGDASVGPEVRTTMSDSARAGALEVVGGQGYLVITRESMATVLKDMGTCAAQEGECEVETGRLIGADLLVTGHLVRVEQALVLTLKLFEVGSGALLATQVLEAPGPLELLRGIPAAARTLTTQGLVDKR